MIKLSLADRLVTQQIMKKRFTMIPGEKELKFEPSPQSSTRSSPAQKGNFAAFSPLLGVENLNKQTNKLLENELLLENAVI